MPKYQVFDSEGNLIEEWETPDEPDPVLELSNRLDEIEQRITNLEENNVD